MAKKIDIKDTTFLVPARMDSITRLENIVLVVNFLSSHFDTNINILEAAPYNNQLLDKLLPPGVSHIFIEDQDPIFHRTKYINRMVRACSTPYLSVWDADVLIPPKQILESIRLLRADKTDFVYPYKHEALDTSSILRELYVRKQEISLLKEHTGKMKKMYLPEPVGGAFITSRKIYVEAGLENELFYGWGREDGDRINRWKILGHAYERVAGPLFHLTHERGNNSTFHSPRQRGIKHAEILRIAAMTKKELKAEINTWKD
jgi:predicted glycosyltransferase involved in capsule biosynthesis